MQKSQSELSKMLVTCHGHFNLYNIRLVYNGIQNITNKLEYVVEYNRK